MRVENVMHGGDAAPRVAALTTPMPDVIHEMSSKRLGMTCVVDDERPAGGRVHRRRPAAADDEPARRTRAGADRRRRDDAAPLTIPRALLAVEALDIMEARKITSIVVVDDDGLVEGVVHLHDLWRTQMF